MACTNSKLNSRSLLNPLVISFGVYFPFLLIYALISDKWYFEHFNSPKVANFFSYEFGYVILLLFLFSFGAVIGGKSFKAHKHKPVLRPFIIPRFYFRVGFLLVIFAYIYWFETGILRAGSITNFVSIYASNPFYVKETILETFPGITTLTQVAVSAVPLAFYYSKLRKLDWFLIVSILILTTIRSFIFSERLAIIELALPIIVILIFHYKLNLRIGMKYFLSLLITVTLFFILTEVRRSFVYLGIAGAEDILSNGLSRLAGYYLTSINNMFFVIREMPYAAPFYYSFQIIWKFPGLGLDTVYGNLTGARVPNMPLTLYLLGLNPEYNVTTTLGALVMDFGYYGALIAIYILGFISGYLYEGAQRGGMYLVFYSIWVVGLFEFMRIFYFASTRLFPAYMFFVGAMLLQNYVAHLIVKPRFKKL